MSGTIDPIRVIRRHVWWILAAVVAGAALGVVAFLLLDRYYSLYESEVLFELRPGVRESREIGTADAMSDDHAERLGSTEAILLTSRDVLERAIAHPDIRLTEWHKRFIYEDESGQEVFDEHRAVDELEETLGAGLIAGTNFFRLDWRAHHAEDAPIILNRVAKAYLERRREDEEEVWRENAEAFENQLSETTRDIENLEDEIRDFIQSRGLHTLDDLRYHQLFVTTHRFTEQLGQAQMTMNMLRTNIEQLRTKLAGTFDPTPEDLAQARAHPLVAQQRGRISAIELELKGMRDRFSDDHHSVRRMEERLRAAERQEREIMDEVLQETLEARLRTMENQFETYQNMAEELRAELDARDGQLGELASAQAQYQAMEARLERLEQRRVQEMELRSQLQLMRARADASRVRLAHQAVRPREKAFPRAAVVVPLTTLLVLAGTVGVIFLREMTDQRVKGASDLAVLPGASVLGVIPELEEDPTRSRKAEGVVRAHPHSVLAESYRQACAMLTRAMERNGHQTVLFVGGLPGSGVTTSLTNVATALAATGKRVCVVDANFRRPHLAEAMGVAGDRTGLGDLLVGAATVEEATVEGEGDVWVVPAGTPGNRVFERLNNGLFESVIAELRGRFDVVLFDSPPAVVAGDALVLANRVDAAVLVVRANQEQRGLVARILNQLADARCESLGVLLNRPRGTAGGYFKKNFEAMAQYSGQGKK